MRPASHWVAARARGWVLYDADCGFCTRWAWRLARLVSPRGFHLAPLQAPWVRPALRLSSEELLDELRVLTAGGAIHCGADALVYLAEQVPCARPLAYATHLPGVMFLLRAAYRWIARHRHAISRACSVGIHRHLPPPAPRSSLTHGAPGASR